MPAEVFRLWIAEIVKVKGDSALIAQNQLARSGTSVRFKLDDAQPTLQPKNQQAWTLLDGEIDHFLD